MLVALSLSFVGVILIAPVISLSAWFCSLSRGLSWLMRLGSKTNLKVRSDCSFINGLHDSFTLPPLPHRPSTYTPGVGPILIVPACCLLDKGKSCRGLLLVDANTPVFSPCYKLAICCLHSMSSYNCILFHTSHYQIIRAQCCISAFWEFCHQVINIDGGK